MGEPHIAHGDSDPNVALGLKLRETRRRKGMTLQQVGEGAGLSKSFMSQIESGTARPSIASLKRIGDVLGIPLAVLFDDEHGSDGSVAEREQDGSDGNGPSRLTGRGGRERTHSETVRVVRRDRRKTIGWPGSNAKTYLLTPDLQRKLEVILSTEEPGHSSGEQFYSHEGEEFGFVLEGRYEVTVGDDVFVLEEGDSIYFPSYLPHKTRVVGDSPARTLWVVTPPSF